jgi:hypothetical protein
MPPCYSGSLGLTLLSSFRYFRTVDALCWCPTEAKVIAPGLKFRLNAKLVRKRSVEPYFNSSLPRPS